MSRKRLAQYSRRRRRKRSIGRVVLKTFEIALCLGVFGTFAYKFLEYAEGSTDFHVRNVEIHGLLRLNEDEVLERSGITFDRNILFFDSEEVRVRVEELPYVRTCRVSTVFPDSVVLNIVEREAVATLMIHSRAYEVDWTGVVLREYASTELPLEPYITNIDGLDFVEVGVRVDRPGFAAAMELWRVFSPSAAGQDLRVSELAAYHPDDIRMYCDELPYEIRWGRGNLAAQVRRLNVLWKELDGAIGCSEYLDLRFNADLACK